MYNVMTEAYIGVGSNVGDREFYIGKAIEFLEETPGIRVDKISPLYVTDPAGGPPQDKFLNGVIKITTELTARELLHKLMAVETRLGRTRTLKDGPRIIDLDILIFGDLKIDEEGLVIPHPRMEERDFVQRPLKDLQNIE